MTSAGVDEKENELHLWNSTAEPTAENFRKFANGMEYIYNEKKRLKMVTRAQASYYLTTISAYRENANALDNLQQTKG